MPNIFQGAKKPDPKGGSKGGKAQPGKAKKEGGGKAKKKVDTCVVFSFVLKLKLQNNVFFYVFFMVFL